MPNEAVLLENAREVNGEEVVDEISYKYRIRGRRRKGLETMHTMSRIGLGDMVRLLVT